VVFLVLMEECRKYYLTEITFNISKSGYNRSCKSVILRVKSRLVLDHGFSDCGRRATTGKPPTVYRYAALIKNKNKSLTNVQNTSHIHLLATLNAIPALKQYLQFWPFLLKYK